MSSAKYDCDRCPAYCCTYPTIEVTAVDVKRLARYFDISEDKARKRFTKKGEKKKDLRRLRHRRDPYFGTACRFLDQETRGCTIYGARPAICRNFPGLKRCGYYDFLTFERELLEDPEHVAMTCEPG